MKAKAKEMSPDPGMDSLATILIVDDEDDIRLMLQDFLTLEGYVVFTAQNAQQALEVLETTLIDVMIADLMMPKMDGIALTKAVNQLGLTVPVIVMTGFVSIEYAVESMKAGAADFVTKPLNLDHVLLIIEKVLEKRKLEKMAKESEFYRRLSHLDDLTEISNHRHFSLFLQAEIDRQQRYSRTLTLIMIDIDNFKHFNDTYGHLCGDFVLRQTAVLLKRSVRGCDFVARYGGEEFVVVLPETSGRDAVLAGQRILAEFAVNFIKVGKMDKEERVSATLGMAFFPRHAHDQLELIARADQALYRGKAYGKNCLCIFGKRFRFVKLDAGS